MKNIPKLTTKYFNIPDVSDSDLFQVEYKGEKIKIKGKFLKLGQERELLQKLKKFNLG